MLVLIFFLFAMIFVQRASLALQDGEVPNPEAVLEQFGSVELAMLSLYASITGGDDWNNYYTTLLGTGEVSAALFIFFIAFMQIAVLNILTGIFVEQAMKSAQPDRDSVAASFRWREVMEAEDLRSECRQIDKDGDGFITLAELADFLETGKFRHFLQSHDIDVRDEEVFFELLRSHEGETMSIDEFVEECMKLKGAATSLDLHYLTKQVGTIVSRQEDQYHEMMNVLRHFLSSTKGGASSSSLASPPPRRRFGFQICPVSISHGHTAQLLN